jgi:hypothetical protein
MVYLDDIPVWSNKFLEHVSNVCDILNLLAKDGFLLNKDKSKLVSMEIELLGHVVKNQMLFPQPDKTAKVLDFRKPQNKTEVRQFVGIIQYL